MVDVIYLAMALITCNESKYWSWSGLLGLAIWSLDVDSMHLSFMTEKMTWLELDSVLLQKGGFRESAGCKKAVLDYSSLMRKWLFDCCSVSCMFLHSWPHVTDVGRHSGIIAQNAAQIWQLQILTVTPGAWKREGKDPITYWQQTVESDSHKYVVFQQITLPWDVSCQS